MGDALREPVHLTRRGYEALQEELRRLKNSERPRIVEQVKLAREHGDLSENAEYDAAKDAQGQLERRIQMLDDKLARAEVVDTGRLPLDRVRFGTKVVLEDLDSGEEVTYTLVGEEESDVSGGLLSIRSPVGRALIGKRIEDEVSVAVPSGTKLYEVRDIKSMD